MSIFKKLFKSYYEQRYMHIAMPAAVECVFMNVLASADLIMVGSLGAVSIAAVSIFLQPRMVLLCFARSIGSAVTLLTARKAGAKDVRGVSELLRKTLFLGFIFMGLLHILFYAFLQKILLLMGAGSDYLPQALQYAGIATVSVFITSMTAILQAVQLGFGETTPIMRTNVTGNTINVIINALLIFGLGPFPRLGIVGAAVGTVVGTLFTLCATIYVMHVNRYFSQGGSFIPDKAYFKEFLPVFGSIFSEQGCERVGMVLFARMAAGLGTVPFAVHSICMSICDYYYDFVTGMGKASMVLAGQSCGAQNEKEWQIYRRVGLKWSMIFSSVSFLIIVLFQKQIFSVYSDDPAALAMSGVVMFLVALVGYPEAHALVSAGILRGSGKTASVAAYSFMSVTVIRPLMTAFFLYVMNLGLLGTWLALVLDQCIRAGCASLLLYRMKPHIGMQMKKLCEE
ncbi:MAG: MATE family efflux transporter [Acidaminococcaceae bacterium]|nr:MATE family efflux transporter [Acidaminococcaceae bacterium]